MVSDSAQRLRKSPSNARQLFELASDRAVDLTERTQKLVPANLCIEFLYLDIYLSFATWQKKVVEYAELEHITAIYNTTKWRRRLWSKLFSTAIYSTTKWHRRLWSKIFSIVLPWSTIMTRTSEDKTCFDYAMQLHAFARSGFEAPPVASHSLSMQRHRYSDKT